MALFAIGIIASTVFAFPRTIGTILVAIGGLLFIYYIKKKKEEESRED